MRDEGGVKDEFELWNKNRMNNAFPLTVVIPTFNCARYISATIHSALRIKDASIIIADDASCDGTTDVVKRYVDSSDGRVSLIRGNINIGMTANWQRAMSEVRTPFALKLDGDDIIFPDYVFNAVDVLLQCAELGIVGGRANRIDSNQLLTDEEVAVYFDNELRADSSSQKNKMSVYRGSDAAGFLLKWNPYPCSSTTIYRMNAWRAVGGFYEKLKWCTDREIWFRIAREHSVGFVDFPSALYRIHSNNVTASLGRSDLYCYDLDLMFRHARMSWPERELKVAFRREVFKIAKAYFGSSYRCILAGKRYELIPRIIKGMRAFLYGVTL